MGSTSSTKRPPQVRPQVQQAVRPLQPAMPNLEIRPVSARKENYYIMGPPKVPPIPSSTPEPVSNVNTPANSNIVVAQYDHQTLESSDLSFVTGDRMEVLDNSDPEWWNVKLLRTGEQGFIPWNYVTKEGPIDNENWYFGKMKRDESERLLLVSGNPRGTFMVRKSEQNPNRYSLSIRDWDQRKGHHVKHYKVEKNRAGGFFVAKTLAFPSVQALVLSYSNNAQGMCHVLLKPCPRPKPLVVEMRTRLENIKEIDKNEIQLIRKIRHGNDDQVWFGTWRNNIEVIVKTLRPGTRLKIMNAVCVTEEPIYVVQEHKNTTTMLGFIKQ